MENLSYINNNQLSQDQLIRIGDIVNFEGPLMTLYQDQKYFDLYIFDWVDRDDTTNRWLAYQVDAYALNKFVNKDIQHQELFESISDRPIYVVDILHGNLLQNSMIRHIGTIPEKYMPENIFFDEQDCPSLDKIKNAIIGSLRSIHLHNRLRPSCWIMSCESSTFYTQGSFEINTIIKDPIYFRFNKSVMLASPIFIDKAHMSIPVIQDLSLSYEKSSVVKKNNLDKIDRSQYAY
ncbi:hypothetical protein [Sphingobacterium siyangense]|uniref:hypothetical protein n=1 Tax=Sphingobacterium siyangense TaxID=459529 RepID=UPI003DA56D2B